MPNYLYNGVELPSLPEWDKETYPVACVVPWEVAGYKYAVYICQSVSYNGTSVILKGGGGHYVIAENGAEWYDHPDYSASASIACESAIWCNTDILNTDGTTYLAASEPIPVGSEPEKPTTFTPDPISMTLGWLVGRRIAGQRGKIQPDIPDVPDVSSGVYDDTFPIEWNTLAVLGNPTVTSGDRELVKVSNLTPTAEEMANTIMRGTFRGNWYDFPCSDSQSLDVGHVALYGSLLAFVVTTAGQSELGVNFPETGIYVLNDGNDGTDEGYAIQEAPKTPIAYLYNGVQLPDINTVWTDKETYPYAAIIGYSAEQDWRLCLSPLPFMFENGIFLDDWSNARVQLAEPLDGEWQLDNGTTDLGGDFTDALWTSHDILNTDGTTYLAASEPIPVYE